MVLEGFDAIKSVRLMVGSTRPYEAAPGTIRGDYAQDPSATSFTPRTPQKPPRRKSPSGSPAYQVEQYQRDLDKWVYE